MSARAPALMSHPLSLASPISVGDSPAELVIVVQIEVVQIEPVQQPFLLDLSRKIFDLTVDILRADCAAGADQ